MPLFCLLLPSYSSSTEYRAVVATREYRHTRCTRTTAVVCWCSSCLVLSRVRCVTENMRVPTSFNQSYGNHQPAPAVNQVPTSGAVDDVSAIQPCEFRDLRPLTEEALSRQGILSREVFLGSRSMPRHAQGRSARFIDFMVTRVCFHACVRIHVLIQK